MLKDKDTVTAVKNPYDYIAHELWNSLNSALRQNTLEELNENVAVGALDNMSVNALCAKSPEGFIAIVINSGLMLLLNKLSKILIAIHRPSSVVYCNRSDPEQITSEMLKSWYVEVCEHYRRTGWSLGPQIHLDEAASASHSIQLNLWEMYVLCHEIGHVLCNHLDNSKYMSGNPLIGMVPTLNENTYLEMETEADVLGYLLLLEYFQHHSADANETSVEGSDDRMILSTLIRFFNLLHLLGSSETKTHPHPLDRLCDVVLNVYGESVAKILAKSYDNHDLLEKLFERPLVARRLTLYGEIDRCPIKQK